jgi:hypothetical protein
MVLRIYHGQKKMLMARFGIAVPHATPRIPIDFTKAMLSIKFPSPSAKANGTTRLCWPMPRIPEATTEAPVPNSQGTLNIHST